ncbi:MAG: ABC transporter ATP-binding protein [Deltaproteobacteria bacterium]|nr:ABC transporter ATP-binding protein [Candidatus Anaeroferrophillacea bacterium]
MNQTPLIAVRNLRFAYPGCRPVLDDLELTVHAGERLGLIAPNGSGKTTLFHLLVGLLRPDAGSIEIFGRPAVEEQDFVAARRRIGLLFQDADDQLFSPTVIEDVAFGPLNLGKSREDALAISRLTLARLGLEGFDQRITARLSGGEKRLVALATVLAMEPEVLLLDEPSAGLDETTKQHLIQLLRDLEISYMIVSHEVDFLSQVVDRVYLLSNGRLEPAPGSLRLATPARTAAPGIR